MAKRTGSPRVKQREPAPKRRDSTRRDSEQALRDLIKRRAPALKELAKH